jgi:uncharacterized surface protein with fasciclin (FAS1) repeats
MNSKLIYTSFLVIAGALLLASCDPWAENTKLKNSSLDKTVLELLQANPEVSTFNSILQKTGYDRFLQEEQSLTVFAPVNSALQSININDNDQLKEWVKNYIALLSYYTNESKQFEMDEVQMINGKTVQITGSVISGANVIQSNLIGVNGVIHLIDNTIIDRKNIWEYLNEQTGYEQINIIRSFDETVMDMDRSVQTGVDIDGKPLYDTVWMNRNVFLENYPLDNERQLFTYILLDNDALDFLKTKYGKYFAQQDEEAQKKLISYEVASDLVLNHQTIEKAGRFESQNDILVDIDPADIKEAYQASNGIIYKVSRADIKIYENKIKTRIIEAENYLTRWPNDNSSEDAWALRYRNWASGGQDILLKGFTRNTIEWDVYDEVGDSIIHNSKTFTFDTKYRDNDNVSIKSSNAYLRYTPVLYSTDYKIYWVAYDDLQKHYMNFTDTIQQPMVLEQKLFISFPGEPELLRNTDAKISNNFSANTVFAGKSIAGIHEETQVMRYTVTTTNEGIFILDQLFTNTDKFGDQTTLKCPAYGTATFFVANTPRETNTNSGILFLDYIKLVPLVDPND